ncbi:hypothetical protein [Lysobacter gummosus]
MKIGFIMAASDVGEGTRTRRTEVPVRHAGIDSDRCGSIKDTC